MPSQPLDAVSPWWPEVGPPAPPLCGERRVDAAVVGGGLTGLSAAAALRREGLSVVLLEAERCGFGASGRNAGHVTPTIGKDLFTLTRLFGDERVGALVRLMETAITHVEETIRKHAIECDYEPVGNVVAAVHPRQHASLDRAAEAAARHGVRGEILEAAALERRGLPRAVTRGYFEPHGGILNPARYLLGLLRVARELGAEIYEQTPVRRISPGSELRIETPGGSVRCRTAVLATNAYGVPWRALRRYGLPLHVQLFRTEPLDAASRAALGWPGREGLYTAHEVLESYRLTPDGRLLGGSKRVRYGLGGRMLPDVEGSVARLLEETFRARFPELHGVRVERHWGGRILVGLDFLPTLRRLGRHGNLLTCLGYAGHGIPLASYAGEMLTDLLLGREGPGTVLASRRVWPLPPEPLRWIVFQALHGGLQALDRRADRDAPRRPPPA